MSSSSEEMPSIRCVGCGKKLKYPAKLAGKQIACPKCGESLTLPLPDTSEGDSFVLADVDLSPPTSNRGSKLPPSAPIADKKQEIDDDEFRLAPTETVAKKTKPFSAAAGFDLANINLENVDLGDFESVEKPKAKPVSDFKSTQAANAPPSSKASSNGSSNKNATSSRTDFRYPCKVCGTAMYAEISDVGKNVRCPDCYTEFSIPSPPPGWNRVKNVGPTTLDDGAALPLSAIEGRGVRTSGPTINTAAAMMAKAAAELQEDDEETRNETYDFDTASWGIRNFGFLRDPSAVVIAIVSGALLGGALVAGQYVGELAARSKGGAGGTPDEIDSMRAIANNLTLLLLATPVFMGALANGIAVLEASANQLRRIARWPAFNLGEAMGEITVVAAAFLVSALPGALLQWFGSAIGVPGQFATIVGLLITWFAFPILLLSMLDNQSVGEPISQDVVRSIQSRHNAWGAMYMMSGLAFVAFFFLYLIQANDRSGLRFAIGMSLPILIFFVFHQYGLLGARISSVTELGFESIDEEEPEVE